MYNDVHGYRRCTQVAARGTRGKEEAGDPAVETGRTDQESRRDGWCECPGSQWLDQALQGRRGLPPE